jgi:hypothetical protein
MRPTQPRPPGCHPRQDEGLLPYKMAALASPLAERRLGTHGLERTADSSKTRRLLTQSRSAMVARDSVLKRGGPASLSCPGEMGPSCLSFPFFASSLSLSSLPPLLSLSLSLSLSLTFGGTGI